MVRFPQPIKLSPGSTRWRLSDLETYEAMAAGDAAPTRRDPADERYLSVRQVAQRYGASVPSVWRWAREAEVA